MILFLMSVARLSCMLVDKIGLLMKERVYACMGGANGRVGLGSTALELSGEK